MAKAYLSELLRQIITALFAECVEIDPDFGGHSNFIATSCAHTANEPGIAKQPQVRPAFSWLRSENARASVIDNQVPRNRSNDRQDARELLCLPDSSERVGSRT